MQESLQIQIKTGAQNNCTAPLTGSGKGQAAQKGHLGLQRAFFLKTTEKKSVEVLLNSLPYSQFAPELGITKQGRPSPPHHCPICREAQPDPFSCAKGVQ